MQIGKGKQGVKIGEYSVYEHEQDTNPTLGYIEPACANPQWILWFNKNGDALLYTKRAPGGAVQGDPIKIKATKPTKRLSADPTADDTRCMGRGY